MSNQNLGGFVSATFNSLTDQKTATVEYLVVAGGGAAVWVQLLMTPVVEAVAPGAC